MNPNRDRGIRVIGNRSAEHEPRDRSTGIYVGEYVEDIYIKRGEFLDQGGEKNEITTKKYIIKSANFDYDIEVGTALDTRRPAGKKNNLALPSPLNLTPDSHECYLTIAAGDEFVDLQGNTWTVTQKYYRPMSGGQLKIGILLA